MNYDLNIMQKEINPSVRERISELIIDSIRHEGYYFYESSADLIYLLQMFSNFKIPDIFLLSDGDFQAIWKNEILFEEIKIKFLGGGLLEYQIVKNPFLEEQTKELWQGHTNLLDIIKILEDTNTLKILMKE